MTKEKHENMPERVGKPNPLFLEGTGRPWINSSHTVVTNKNGAVVGESLRVQPCPPKNVDAAGLYEYHQGLKEETKKKEDEAARGGNHATSTVATLEEIKNSCDIAAPVLPVCSKAKKGQAFIKD